MYIPASFLLLESCPTVSARYRQNLDHLKLHTDLEVLSGENRVHGFFHAIEQGENSLEDFDVVLLDKNLGLEILDKLKTCSLPGTVTVLVSTSADEPTDCGMLHARLPFDISTIVMLIQQIEGVALSIVRTNPAVAATAS